MRVAVTSVALVAMLSAFACSGGSDGTKSTAVVDGSDATVAAATAEANGAFDPNVLTAIALQPGDVPAGMAQSSASFSNEYNGSVISYSTTYGGDGLSISSSIGHAAPGGSIDQAVLRLRQAQTGLMRLERNYTIDGADQAFAYGHPQALAVATLVLKDGYYVNVVVQTRDNARTAEAQDQANLDRYTKIVFDRLKAYLADPSSVTPVAGIPRYQPATGDTPD